MSVIKFERRDRSSPPLRRRHSGLEKGARSRCQLTTIDGVFLSFDGAGIPLSNRKAQALLVYLASRKSGSESRERLAGLLWSESEEHKARCCLRQTIADLKATLSAYDPEIFIVDRTMVRLDIARLKVDVQAVLDEVGNGRVPGALLECRAFSEQFLANFEDLDAAFRNWLLAERQLLHDRLIRALEQMAREDESYENRQLCGAAIVNLDPTNEIGCRLLIEAHVRGGNIGGALRVYNELWRLLGEEFDAEPSPATQALIVAVKTGRLDEISTAACEQ